MIIGEPTLKSVLDLIEAEGCPYCGEIPREIFVDGPADIILECGHVVDAKAWIDSHYPDGDPHEVEPENEDG